MSEPTAERKSLLPDAPRMGDKEVASRIWGILMHRMAPIQVSALARIAHVHPTARELASYLGMSAQQASNIANALYREGFLIREKADRSYRYAPAFPAPLPYHYFDRRPLVITDPAMVGRVEEILTRRGKL